MKYNWMSLIFFLDIENNLNAKREEVPKIQFYPEIFTYRLRNMESVYQETIFCTSTNTQKC